MTAWVLGFLIKVEKSSRSMSLRILIFGEMRACPLGGVMLSMVAIFQGPSRVSGGGRPFVLSQPADVY